MATVTYTVYNGGQIHAERTNEYICDGHGTEVLSRTNRYLTDGHGLNTECVGINGCPSDPELASRYMETLRANYERQHEGNENKGRPVAHYQLFFSWATDERVSHEERYEMTREVFNRVGLDDFPALLSPHDNTDEDHMHASVCAFSADGTHKLCMNNALLYKIRREMDYVCVEHGYSIVTAPELWGDKEYKQWFETVRSSGIVKVHPPVDNRKRKQTKGEEYADAKGHDPEEEERQREEYFVAMMKREPTEEERADYFYLPHIFDPAKPSEPLYLYRKDKDGNILPSLDLELLLRWKWAKTCNIVIDSDVVRKKFDREADNVKTARSVLRRLDIKSKEELIEHAKRVGADIGKYKKEVERQKDSDDPKAIKRYNRAVKKLDELSKEYRDLKMTAAVIDETEDIDRWMEHREKLFRSSTRRPHDKQLCYDIGKAFGFSTDDIDRLYSEAESNWVTYRYEVIIAYRRRREAYSYIREQEYRARQAVYEESRELRRILQPVGIITAILFAVIIATRRAKELEKLERESYIAQMRAALLANDIERYNQNIDKNFEAAKSQLAIKLFAAEAEQIDTAWSEFFDACDKLIREGQNLTDQEIRQYAGPASVRSILEEVERMKAGLDNQITDAAERAVRQAQAKEKDMGR